MGILQKLKDMEKDINHAQNSVAVMSSASNEIRKLTTDPKIIKLCVEIEKLAQEVNTIL